MRLTRARAAMADTAEDPRAPRVPCPACRRETVYSSRNPWRPFCSERCRRVDLGAWASEHYRVASPIPPDGDADEPAR